MNAFEKFPEEELRTLRDEIRFASVDYFQSAELLAAFLAQHGYGVSGTAALVAAARIEKLGFALPEMQEQLEKIAWMM